MTEYDNTNRGVLFKNDKEGNEKRPDYTGSINIDGTEYFLSAWIKEAKNGNKFMSLSRGDVKTGQKASQTSQNNQPDFDEDVPF